MKTKGDSFYIYGKKPVEEQLMRNPENVMRVFVSDKMAAKQGGFQELKNFAKENRIPINPVTKTKIQDYVGDVNDQGVVALLRRPEYVEFDEWFNGIDMESMPCVLVLDHIEDTHNFGAILRTAAAVGITGVIVSKDRQAPVNGTVYKTSAGALTHVPIVRVANINQAISRLKDAHFWVSAIDMDEEAKHPLTVWTQKFDSSTVIVMGGEGKGVSEKVRENADFIVSIPMENDVESLNVSVAAAVVLYEWKRQIQSFLKK
ncbi:MAG: 23S rRNA (guanosine(2251)-2'-O)-methyltransferase RlmB [Candidatus Pacebacteria bacterium]|nr:23S rRNA (guanosine(2251)-2'-O)-methyltransferase RlmB [Candidatus Paceibacterota bacterium]